MQKTSHLRKQSPVRRQVSPKILAELLSTTFWKQQSESSDFLAALIKHSSLDSSLEVLHAWIIVISFTELLEFHVLI